MSKGAMMLAPNPAGAPLIELFSRLDDQSAKK